MAIERNYEYERANFQNSLRPPVEIETQLSDIHLRELKFSDIVAYHFAVQGNREHLSQFGDETGEKYATLERTVDAFRFADPAKLRFGIFKKSELIGTVNLVSAKATTSVSPRPGEYVLGYWLSAEQQGYGYVTAAANALIQHAKEKYGAMHIYAGVAHGNRRSMAVLERLCFEILSEHGNHTTFYREA